VSTLDGCEVRDYVVPAVGLTSLRMNNEAANAEHVRRGEPEQVAPSGELLGDAIAWVNTCGGVVVVPGAEART